MLPANEEMAARILNLDRRVKRLETLEDAGGGDWVLIETIELSDSNIAIEFTDIPQIYQHLWIIYSAGTTGAGVQHIRMNFNNDVGNKYNHIGNVFSNTGARTTDAVEADVDFHVGKASSEFPGRGNNYAAGHITIPDYMTDDKFRPIVFANYYDALGAFEVPDGWAFVSGGGIWEDQDPVTEIDFTLENAASFREGTVFSLYGVN